MPSVSQLSRDYCLKCVKKTLHISGVCNECDKPEPVAKPQVSALPFEYGYHTSASIALGLHRPRERVSDSELTERERQVRDIIAGGDDLFDCAEILGISRDSCAHYLERVREKLGYKTVDELTALLREGRAA